MYSKRNFYFGIVSICLFNLVIRYPDVWHIGGSDIPYYLNLTDSIIINGNISWLNSIGSSLAWAPYSENISLPVLIASISYLAGVNIEISNLLVALLSSIILPLCFFTVIKPLTSNHNLLIIGLLIFSFNFEYLYITLFRFTARSLFILLLLPTIGLMFRYDGKSNNSPKYLVLLILLFICLLMTHNFILYFAVLTFLPFILTRLVLRFSDYSSENRNRLVYFVITSSSIVVFSSSFGYPIMDYYTQYNHVVLPTFGSNPISEVFNLAIFFYYKNSYWTVACIFGIFHLFTSKYKDFFSIFLVFSIFLSSFFVWELHYFLQFSFVFISLLTFYSIVKLDKYIVSIKNKALPILIILILTSSSTMRIVDTHNYFSYERIGYDGNTYITSEVEVDASLYLVFIDMHGSHLSNSISFDYVNLIHLNETFDYKISPILNPDYQSFSSLENPEIDTFILNLREGEKITIGDYLTGPDYRRPEYYEIAVFLWDDPDTALLKCESWEINAIVVTNFNPKHYLSYSNRGPSSLLYTLPEEKYTIFENNGYKIHAI